MFLLINHTGYVILKYESNPKERMMIMAGTVAYRRKISLNTDSLLKERMF